MYPKITAKSVTIANKCPTPKPRLYINRAVTAAIMVVTTKTFAEKFLVSMIVYFFKEYAPEPIAKIAIKV